MQNAHINYILDVEVTRKVGFSPCLSCKDSKNCISNNLFDKCDIKKKYDLEYKKGLEEEYNKLRGIINKDY